MERKILDLAGLYPDRPLLVGRVSVALGISLNRAENLLEGMVDAGLMRVVTPSEKRQFDVIQGYMLVRRGV